MAVSIEDIKKLRNMTGAGLSDCKNALNEAEGNLEAAIELIRKRGQAIAAKRSDREAAEGCVLVKVDGNFGVICALKCETDFVAKNADFVALANEIIDAALAARCTSIEEVKNLTLGGRSVAERITELSGVTGEKMELDGYLTIESDNISCYNHQGKNMLCTMVALNKSVDPAYGHAVAMQVAAMNPVSLCEQDVPEKIRQEEYEIAADKARQEGKPENMIERIAQGRMQKFYKEACLLNQEFIQDSKLSVAAYLKQADKECTVTAFKRFTLRAE